MSTRPEAGRTPERRTGGTVRVPFIRRCHVLFEGASGETALTVNINVLGAYLARDAMPRLGQRLTITFRTPDRDADVVVQGAVTWINPRQQHPVHSLPPGFGVKFDVLTEPVRRVIERVVEEYVARNPQITR